MAFGGDSIRPIARADAVALIGLLATLEGLIWVDRIAPAEIEDLIRRFQKDGMLPTEAGAPELRQALGNLNQRLRFAIGEYAEPPPPKNPSAPDPTQRMVLQAGRP